MIYKWRSRTWRMLSAPSRATNPVHHTRKVRASRRMRLQLKQFPKKIAVCSLRQARFSSPASRILQAHRACNPGPRTRANRQLGRWSSSRRILLTQLRAIPVMFLLTHPSFGFPQQTAFIHRTPTQHRAMHQSQPPKKLFTLLPCRGPSSMTMKKSPTNTCNRCTRRRGSYMGRGLVQRALRRRARTRRRPACNRRRGQRASRAPSQPWPRASPPFACPSSRWRTALSPRAPSLAPRRQATGVCQSGTPT
mmetsp:Transcript_37221/g.71374  ORF Transcript_37221/g.71374 Transcript_37221/m.71374 type:complete len:250 (-) Transcript_37221:67-816(-)